MSQQSPAVLQPASRPTAPPRPSSVVGGLSVEQRERLRLDRRERERRRRRARIRRNRIVAGSGLSVVIGLLVGISVVLSGGSSPASGRPGGAASPPSHPVAAALDPLLPSRLVVPGASPQLTWPARGEAAVGVAGVGEVGASPRESSVPIASLTKLMTAYLVLRDHPLGPGAPGPSLTMTRPDVAEWVHASQNDDSNVQVRLGEVLSEHQLLEALLMPSADNVADLLATWDAGSVPAFVAKMNAAARSLGMSATHYADASGVDPGSRSDASDQERIASLLMASPAVRQIVSQPDVAFPVAGTIVNVNPALGVDGIVGIKSGFTSQALGCLATAAYRVVGDHRVLVVSVTLGQPDGLYGAARSDEQLLGQATKALVSVPVVAARQQVARISTPWAQATLGATAPAAPSSVVGWPGLVLSERLVPGAGLIPASARGAGNGRSRAERPSRSSQPVVGALEVSGPDGVLGMLPLTATGAIPAVPAGWSPPRR